MRRVTVLLLCLLAPVWAQGGTKKNNSGKKGAPAAAGKYSNPDLGISFGGVYGWEMQRAEGSGAWTRLVRYYDEDFDAEVILLVRNNPYKLSEELKTVLVEEFKEGGEVAAGKVIYKNISVTEADMKGGNKLPGFEVQGIAVRLNEEGKVRERAIVIRTYFGANRLYRVFCTVRKRRLKNVRDLFTRAGSGLAVTGSLEKVVRGVPFRSSRGRYSCAIPEGFMPDLPISKRNFDMQFVGGKRGSVRIYVYAFAYDGEIEDQKDDLLDFYGDSMKMNMEPTEGKKRLGGPAFEAVITKSGRVTVVTAAVVGERVYRVHTAGPKDKLKDLEATHAKFVKGFRAGR